MKTPLLTTCALALSVASIAAPDLAQARVHHDHYYTRHYDNRCHDRRQLHGANGAIIGAIGGGIVGNAMSSGNRTGGTLLGAGVGALAGHAVGKNSTRC